MLLLYFLLTLLNWVINDILLYINIFAIIRLIWALYFLITLVILLNYKIIIVIIIGMRINIIDIMIVLLLILLLLTLLFSWITCKFFFETQHSTIHLIYFTVVSILDILIYGANIFDIIF